MRRDSQRGSGRRGSILMFVTMSVPLMVIPLMGLAIDATILRITQAKLSAAVDGASLGAGRLLGTTANTSEIATEFLNANFKTGNTGFWNTSNFVPTVTVTLGTTKTISINATTNAPLSFLRLLGQGGTASLAAAATAIRRDSRVVMVIDRSGSMTSSDGHGSTVIKDLISYAQGFAEKFTEGTDELGLVVYDGSAVVGYPTIRPWDSTTTSTSTGGPDTSFYSGANTDMIHQIAAIKGGGNTGMAEGLWLAYIELQKAHMRDLKANGGVDDRLNSIVLFTDGFPTATTVHLNNASDDSIKATSACTYKANDTKPMIGWVSISGPPFSTTAGADNSLGGVFQLASSNTTDTAAWWMSHADADENAVITNVAGDPFNNCGDITGNNFYDTNRTDLSQLPNIDGWGNSMDGTAYTNSYEVDSNGHIASSYTGTLDHTKPTTAMDWALAAWNGVDNTANNIRNDINLANRAGDTQNMMVAIYTIGYEGDGGVDQGLLLRLANDKSSSSYNGNQSTGMYVPASNTDELANAFSTIGSAILRLSQ